MTFGANLPAVRRRIVLHLGGYDPVTPAEQHRLFVRELARFARTWGVIATASALGGGDDCRGEWTADAAGPNWRCETHYRVLRWDDIVSRDMARGHVARLARAALTCADFVGTGTAWRYWNRRWPYAVFFAYPFAALLLFALIAGLSGLAMGGIPGALAAPVVFAALYFSAGRYWRIPQALDDWNFARDYVRNQRPETVARLKECAGKLLVAADDPSVDEVLLVGHSFGATLALEVLAQALTLRPDLGRAKPFRLLTVGATIPKLGLHPRGNRIRECAAAIVAAPQIDWAEYQAADDPISFYKVNPLTMERQRDFPPGSRPMVRRVHASDMLAAETYHRFRHRWVRLHYQFLMANDVRARYDYFMFVCGPVPFSALVAAPGGPADFFAPDGSRRGDIRAEASA
ncbi:MAG TPA: hypothetical protein VG734_23990 [Lacunisphaera sp.]|nr:hypothetical protein [Lacunisphaera sp.]